MPARRYCWPPQRGRGRRVSADAGPSAHPGVRDGLRRRLRRHDPAHCRKGGPDWRKGRTPGHRLGVRSRGRGIPGSPSPPRNASASCVSRCRHLCRLDPGLAQARRGAWRRSPRPRPRAEPGRRSAHPLRARARPGTCRSGPRSSRGNCGTGPTRALLVDAEHDLAEDRQGRAPAGLSSAQRAVVVEADPDRHRDALRPVGGPHEQRVAEVARRPGLAHHRDREVAPLRLWAVPSGRRTTPRSPSWMRARLAGGISSRRARRFVERRRRRRRSRAR